MRKDYEDIPGEPPAHLHRAILRRIAAEERRRARTRLYIQASTALLSLGALIPAYRYLALQLAETGFAHFLSLAVSDSNVFFAHWQDFLLSLAESLPVTALIILLSFLFLLVGSLRLASQNVHVAYRSAS